ncbi:hypothetical protein ACFLWG_01760 [Chloroflexota bacterium]
MKPIVVAFAVIILEAIVIMILDRMGINPPMWILILIAAICVVVIVWGLIPKKARDWSKETVGLIWPSGYESLSDRQNFVVRLIRRIRLKKQSRGK